MNVLFLTLLDFNSIDDENIYADLLREFVNHGHHAYIISPVERRRYQGTSLIKERGAQILKVKIGNIQKTNVIEKGISTLSVESLFIRGIKKYFRNVRFDLVLYSTPPITFCKVIEYVKNKDGARTYLMLKDIFPQNAVDLGMMKKRGIGGLLYQFFRTKERRLYQISDRIGCMSPANVEYVRNNNPDIDQDKVELCPNSIKVVEKEIDNTTVKSIREKYGIPLTKTIFVYGGNLGKPQGIPFIIDCLRAEQENKNVFFVIIGDGTEYKKIEEYVENEKPNNLLLIRRLPKKEYDTVIASCDVGLIFLDHRFTIPNYPSRLLGYMQAGLPVLAATDKSTDIGRFLEENQIGLSCYSDDVEAFCHCVSKCVEGRFSKQHIHSVLSSNYSVETTYSVIMRGTEK